MTERGILLLLLLLSALTFVAVMAIVIRWLLKRAATRSQLLPVSQERPLIPSNPPFDCVFTRLDFAESFDADLFAKVSSDCALSSLNTNTLLNRAGDGVTVTINSVRLIQSRAELTFSLSKHGQTLLEQGMAEFGRHNQSGKVLPWIRDVQTKKVMEQIKGVPTSTLSTAAAASTAVIGAAHMISGADIAKRLKHLQSKVDLLLVYRRFDQLAKLERIYTAAKELGSGPITHEKCWELWRLRGELRELRFCWRRELQHRLNLIDDPESASFFKRLFTSKNASNKAIHGKITEGEQELVLIEYSMRLDHALAVGSGMVTEFESSLGSELSELAAVAKLLEVKMDLIKGNHQDFSVKPTVDFMTSVVEQYKTLVQDCSVGGSEIVNVLATSEEAKATTAAVIGADC